jgi:hypothetical protein
VNRPEKFIGLRRAFRGRANHWKTSNPDPNYIGLAVSQGMARRRTSKVPQHAHLAKTSGNELQTGATP